MTSRQAPRASLPHLLAERIETEWRQAGGPPGEAAASPLPDPDPGLWLADVAHPEEPPRDAAAPDLVAHFRRRAAPPGSL